MNLDEFFSGAHAYILRGQLRCLVSLPRLRCLLFIVAPGITCAISPLCSRCIMMNSFIFSLSFPVVRVQSEAADLELDSLIPHGRAPIILLRPVHVLIHKGHFVPGESLTCLGFLLLVV